MPPKKKEQQQQQQQQQNEEVLESVPKLSVFGLEIGATLHQCAESHVFDANFCGMPAIVKQRVRKEYRHQVLDERIRNGRMLREARALARALKAGVPCPAVLSCDKVECSIVLEKIDGCTVREVLSTACEVFGEAKSSTSSNAATAAAASGSSSSSSSGSGSETLTVASDLISQVTPESQIDALFSSPSMNQKNSNQNNNNAAPTFSPCTKQAAQIICSRVLFEMGRIIAKLHLMNAMHGDLTTSNFMIRGAKDDVVPFLKSGSATSSSGSSSSSSKFSPLNLEVYSPEVVVIDFGLVQESFALEERAVDLYVLERALVSTHPTLLNAGQVVIDGYCVELRKAAAALKKSAEENQNQNQHQTNPSNQQQYNADAVMERLETVRARGRKRSMLG